MRPPIALTVSGSASDGASGVQADLKTFTALGVHGASAITAVCTVTGHRSLGTHHLPAAVVREQVDAVAEDLLLDATKLGSLGSAAVVRTVAEAVRAHGPRLGRIVLDPVMVDSDGTARISAEGARALREQLVPLAHVLTPNIAEAAQLLGVRPATSIEEMREQGLALQALGPEAVVVTGGALGGTEAVDVVVHPGGTDLLRTPRHRGRKVRGAGATLSAAITAQIARVAELDRAGELGEIGDEGAQDDLAVLIATAREFVASATANSADWEVSDRPGGFHPLNHLVTLGKD
ncbi:bifunctional hydroxymethylpyrimidine kinase/phosphomethylpyrimidine kinase [Brachybacterium sp. DNPG3]